NRKCRRFDVCVWLAGKIPNTITGNAAQGRDYILDFTDRGAKEVLVLTWSHPVKSSIKEYATGHMRRVKRRDRLCPPITATATARRSSAPGPVPRASGSMPPTSASVVINIGRS